MIRPGNIYWYKTVLADFENRDRKFVNLNMKTLIKSELETPSTILSNSKSKATVGWNNYNTLTPGIDYEDFGAKKNPKR